MSKVSFKVVGVTFGNCQAVLQNLFQGGGPVSAQLVPEPQNEVDPNAIKVMAGSASEKVGYIPRTETGNVDVKGTYYLLIKQYRIGGQDQLRYSAVVTDRAARVCGSCGYTVIEKIEEEDKCQSCTDYFKRLGDVLDAKVQDYKIRAENLRWGNGIDQ